MNKTDMNKIAVLELDSLPPGKMACIERNGETVLLANVDGTVHAVSGNCTHEDSSLCLGALKGDHVMCSLHGSLFSLIDGEPDGDPADIPLKVYPVEIEDGSIYLMLDVS